MDSAWLEWARKLQAIAQNGLTFSQNPFDIERYESIRRIAAEMMATLADVPVERVLDLFAQDVGYATPKVDVRGAVFQGDTLLLVRERSDGLWTLPGGWADIGQTPAEAVVREIQEESGYHTRAVKLLAIYDRNKHPHPPMPHHAFKIFFRCELLGGEATTSIETDGVGFFAEDEIPALSTGRTTSGQIARCFEHARHPDWLADFD
ncbi:MAG: NUDIX hydrolase [Gemmatimonadaceae bacterium]|nr:NUDIX hydrolase [Gloeobacterales cyanobacterium ES-bin-141]